MTQEKLLTLEDGKLKQKLITFVSDNADNFSYHYIATDREVVIEGGQHMIALNLEIDGFIQVDGCVVML